ncbi:xanthine dehydrogenase family protein molybdopterin-binding subunit [Geodermatophilus sp. CPCC 205506]|uniref:xanthine dehydrogenase family protein molybdopterin-binding subunit n=1 Tax=Geodermatophilus sp. CPCC 205506 TaxID=2936596 RepID=UPI003EE82260
MSIGQQEPGSTGLIGAPVTRVQDDRMLRGSGWYVDDLDEAGTLHAALVRSPVAHGRVIGYDASAALALEGVALVLGPKELEELLAPLPHPWLIPGQQITDVRLVESVARYVGQPLAVVVARTRAEAEDAAELVDVEFEELGVVSSLREARRDGAPLVHPEFGVNRVGAIHFGDPLPDLEASFAEAALVVDRVFTVPRVAHNPMEPRGLVAEYQRATGRLDVVSSTQVPHLVRQELGRALGLRADSVHVVAPDVGGAFGQKTSLFPDEAMVCAAAKVLGRRVKWIEDRAESLTVAYQGRGQESRGRLAVAADGTFLALHVDIHGDIGAFPSTGTGGAGPFMVSALMAEGPYRFPLAGSTVTAWYTNATPTGAFRGYGMQETTFIRERLVDEAARLLGADPVQLRRRNMLTAAELPFVTRLQMPYDNGDYPGALDRADAMATDRARPSAGRVRRGVGLASMTEITGYAPTALQEAFGIHWTTWDSARIRVNEDGTVTVHSGVTSVGQGIETSLAQVAAERMGVPLSWVTVQLGDTSTAQFNNMGSQASRGLTVAGAALWQAAARLRERMDALAAAHLQVEADGVRLDGDAYVTADGRRALWRDIAHRGWMGWGRRPDDPIALEETVEYDPPSITYGYATHGAEVAVDLDTGRVTVEDYWLVHDAGRVVNPLIVAGQMTGGVAMGIGATLLEEVSYSDTGQPTATTYLDYLLPISEDVPDVEQHHVETASDVTPGGFKGAGESGLIPPPAAIMNAVANAVPEIAERLVAIPLTPSRLWDLLEEAGLTR